MVTVSCNNVKQQDVTESSKISNSEQPEEKEDITLTYSTCSELSTDTQEMIDDFNAENNGYKVVVKDYSENLVYSNPEIKWGASEESLSEVQIEIVQDIISDEIDIINKSAIPNGIKFDILKNKGAFADLYPFMENEPDVNRSVLNKTVIGLSEIDGKLYSLPTFYWVLTLVGESQYIDTKEGRTFDEFVSHLLIEDDFFDSSSENMNGYSITVTDIIILLIDEFKSN